MKSLKMLAPVISLAGCATDIPPPAVPPSHPASAAATSAPLPVLSRTLSAYDPASAPAPETSGSQMDHGAMDHGSKKEMDHGAMDHGSMKGMDHSAMQGKEDSKKEMDPGSMKHGEHDHGAMKKDETGDGQGAMDHGAHWMAPPEAAARKNPVPTNAASIVRGKQHFAANCVICHGATGRGDGPAAAALNPRPADLTAMAGHHPDGDYAWKIANGRGPMPAWKGILSEKQIWDVVNYTQSLGSAKKNVKKDERGGGHDHSKHKH